MAGHRMRKLKGRPEFGPVSGHLLACLSKAGRQGMRSDTLFDCLYGMPECGPLSGPSCMQVIISKINKQMQRTGKKIVCEGYTKGVRGFYKLVEIGNES